MFTQPNSNTMENTTELMLKEKTSPELLATLQGIEAPASIVWWPQTLGWKILAVVFFFFLLYRLYLLAQKYIKNAYRRAAFAELKNTTLTQESLQNIPFIIRRTALYAYDRKEVAPLIGKDWENWLDQQCIGSDFSGKYSGIINTLAYDKQFTLAQDQLSQFKQHVIFWVLNHRGYYD